MNTVCRVVLTMGIVLLDAPSCISMAMSNDTVCHEAIYSAPFPVVTVLLVPWSNMLFTPPRVVLEEEATGAGDDESDLELFWVTRPLVLLLPNKGSDAVAVVVPPVDIEEEAQEESDRMLLFDTLPPVIFQLQEDVTPTRFLLPDIIMVLSNEWQLTETTCEANAMDDMLQALHVASRYAITAILLVGICAALLLIFCKIRWPFFTLRAPDSWEVAGATNVDDGVNNDWDDLLLETPVAGVTVADAVPDQTIDASDLVVTEDELLPVPRCFWCYECRRSRRARSCRCNGCIPPSSTIETSCGATMPCSRPRSRSQFQKRCGEEEAPCQEATAI